MEAVRDDPVAGFPQIIVPGDATARGLELLANRLRSSRGNARLRRLGRYLSYFTDRRHEPGQLALLAATEIVAKHWVTGQDPASDQHLAAALTWVDPPPGAPIWAAVAEAEAEVMGINTDPRFDHDELERLLDRYREVRDWGGTRRQLQQVGWHIREALRPYLLRQLERMNQALELLAGLKLAPHQNLTDMADVERSEFLYFMDQRDQGKLVTRRDSPKAAAVRLAARVAAAGQVAAALGLGEPVIRAEAVLAGRLVRGVVRNPSRVRLAPRQFELTFDLDSAQAAPRARVGDTFVDVVAPERRVRIREVRHTPHGTTLSLEITKGQRKAGLPTAGDMLELATRIPEWEEIIRHRTHVAKVLATPPATHTDTPRLRRPPVNAPPDILADLESLR
jgi:hypothetical protein